MSIFRNLFTVVAVFAVVAAGSDMAITQAQAQELPALVADALKQARIPVRNAGVFVQEAGGGNKVMVSSSAEQAFNPASVMKLVTTDAALELLGPAYSWKTQAYIDGTLDKGVLQGNLSIKGSGDPKLVMENFWMFLRQIRASGVRDIRGNLQLDRSIFEDALYDPSQFDGDPQKPYNAGPDALLLNYKSIAVRFAADPANGQVTVSMEPPLAGYTVAAPRLANGTCNDWQTALQADIGATDARFNGNFSAACGEKIWYIHPWKMNATQYFGAVFRQMWRELGGTFDGNVINAKAAPDARLVAQWQSPALPEVIRDINKYSNNVMARQLLLTIAADVTQQPGNVARGASVIKTWLTNKGLPADDLVIENGAGLSRNERIAPATLGRILNAAFVSPLMPEFLASMPLVGYDGTMRKRLKQKTVAGQAHIKTGSLNDVRSIAGFVQAASGKYYVVVCLINHPNAPQGQKAQDALLQWVYENG